jgi:putative addiction module component (TIGR02574 family)
MASSDPAELAQQAMALPVAARLALAAQLLDSVEGPEDPDWEAAWAVELDRRVKEYEAGTVQAIPAADVLERMRARYQKR